MSNPEMFEKFMRAALKQAEKSLKTGDVPVGAVVVYNGEIIAKGYNQIEKKSNAIQHAEIIAINSAIKKYGHKHLLDCDLYVTLEPCSMCAGAIVLARLKRIFIGTDDPKTGGGGSIFNILNSPRLNHRCEVISGILQDECSAILKNFFKELRKNK